MIVGPGGYTTGTMGQGMRGVDVLVLGFCALMACGPTQSTSENNAATSTSTDTSTSGSEGSQGASTGRADSAGSGDSQADATDSTTATGGVETGKAGSSSTGGSPTACETACVTLGTCDEPSSSCVTACEAVLRFRADHFGEACLAATEATNACIGGLTCEQYDAFACDDAGLVQITVCESDVDAGPSVVAFCDSQRQCDLDIALCQLSILDDFMRTAYIEGCESDYAALLSCAATVGCMATRKEVETTCAVESAALDGCNIFG